MSIPPAPKPGRNQPCWCGSGKKYKHCHLRQDKEAARSVTPPAPAPTTLPSAPIKPTKLTPAPQPSPEQMAEEAEWRRFEQADLAGKVEMFLQRVDEKRLDKEDVFEMLLAIRGDSDPRHNTAARAQFRTLVEHLREAMPKVYQEEQGFLLESLLKDAIADQDWPQVADWSAQFAAMADRNIDEFFNVVHALLYHGQTPSLFQAMQAAWGQVSNAPDITPAGVEDFFGILLDLNLFRYLGIAPNPRADDPALLEPLTGIGGYNPVWLNTALPHLAAPRPTPWEREDLGEAVDAETWEQNMAALLFEFMAERQRAAQVPLNRSNLMQGLLHQVLHQQFTQAAPELPRKGKRKATPPPSSSLIPRYQALDRKLAGKFSLLGSEPYPVAALVELLPAYLHFLARLGLIHPTEMDEALGELGPLAKPLVKVLDSYGADVHAIQNVESAWSEEALDKLRTDPALAETRAQPLILPPPAPNPIADAQTYRFKVTYQHADEVWFLIELQRDQTLEGLHLAIQDAADFDDDHLYSFYLSGQAWDKETEYSPREARYSTRTKIKNVPLRLNQHFLYLFDYGDEHTFDIQLIGASNEAAKHGPYPRLVQQHGRMPPQYGDWDEEEDEENENGEESAEDGEFEKED